MRAANDPLLFMPRTVRLVVPLRAPIIATLHESGLVTAHGLCVSAPQGGEGWLVRLCAALLAVGVDGRRAVIVRRRDRSPVCTCPSIGETAAA